MKLLAYLLFFLTLLQLVYSVDRTSTHISPEATNSLLSRFRLEYQKLLDFVQQAHKERPDVFLLEMLGEELEDFRNILQQNLAIFDNEESSLIHHNIEHMLHDVRVLHDHTLQASHNGTPTVVTEERNGGRGRPRIVIDRNFLAWAYRLRSTSGIADFLGISRTVVRRALLDYGIASPGVNPFPDSDSEDPEDVVPGAGTPEFVQGSSRDGAASQHHVPSSYLSTLTDQELDATLSIFREQFPNAGLSMLDGMLRDSGHVVPRNRVRQSLGRIDPVARVFDRVRLRRRGYRVPGPNSLWHHDGQHGLIRWGIVIHAFIDGYSRMITGIRASANNYAGTVLGLFLEASQVYGIPSRIRGDHGVENVLVAAFMEEVKGAGRGSYIWGRSVHNTRIERLWADVTIGVGYTWHQLFSDLEILHGFDINNRNHVWLLQHLFLPIINSHLQSWARAWNHHPISIKKGPNRRPEDLFGFDMLVHGMRGDPLEEHLTLEELETFGVDWDALQDDAVLQQLRRNYGQDGTSSWLGRRGPPPNLNEVVVHPPSAILSVEELNILNRMIAPLSRSTRPEDVYALWTHALIAARMLHPNEF